MALPSRVRIEKACFCLMRLSCSGCCLARRSFGGDLFWAVMDPAFPIVTAYPALRAFADAHEQLTSHETLLRWLQSLKSPWPPPDAPPDTPPGRPLSSPEYPSLPTPPTSLSISPPSGPWLPRYDVGRLHGDFQSQRTRQNVWYSIAIIFTALSALFCICAFYRCVVRCCRCWRVALLSPAGLAVRRHHQLVEVQMHPSSTACSNAGVWSK